MSDISVFEFYIEITMSHNELLLKKRCCTRSILFLLPHLSLMMMMMMMMTEGELDSRHLPPLVEEEKLKL